MRMKSTGKPHKEGDIVDGGGGLKDGADTSEPNTITDGLSIANKDIETSSAPCTVDLSADVPVESEFSALTSSFSSPNGGGNEESGDDSMDDPRLEQAFNLIRAVIADADKRAADEIVARISGGTRKVDHFVVPHSSNRPDKRAPHGSSQMLIDRALAEAGDGGLTVLGILSKAETEFERMVSASAVRNWLKENERKRPPRYRQIGGVWFLADRGPTVKAVS